MIEHDLSMGGHSNIHVQCEHMCDKWLKICQVNLHNPPSNKVAVTFITQQKERKKKKKPSKMYILKYQQEKLCWFL